MQASRPRNMHTAVAIKQAKHYPTVNLCPSHTPPRPANPRGIQWRTHIPLKNSQRFPKIPKDSHTAPHPRSPHTAVAIKKARHTPTVNLPRVIPHGGWQTLGVSHGLPRRSPSGRRRAPPSSFYRSYKSYKSYASVTPTQHAYRRSCYFALNLRAESATSIKRVLPGWISPPMIMRETGVSIRRMTARLSGLAPNAGS